MWVCFVQEVEAGDEEAAVDAFYEQFDPEHSFVEGALQHADHGPATVFDRRDHPSRRRSPVPNKKESLLYHLRLLSQDWPKGHWLCPCGSGALLRHCHRDDMMDMHRIIPPPAARRMLKRMKADGR